MVNPSALLGGPSPTPAPALISGPCNQATSLLRSHSCLCSCLLCGPAPALLSGVLAMFSGPGPALIGGLSPYPGPALFGGPGPRAGPTPAPLNGPCGPAPALLSGPGPRAGPSPALSPGPIPALLGSPGPWAGPGPALRGGPSPGPGPALLSGPGPRAGPGPALISGPYDPGPALLGGALVVLAQGTELQLQRSPLPTPRVGPHLEPGTVGVYVINWA